MSVSRGRRIMGRAERMLDHEPCHGRPFDSKAYTRKRSSDGPSSTDVTSEMS